MSIPTLRLLAPAVWATSIGSALPETLAPQIAQKAELPFLMAAAPFGMMAAALTLGRADVLVDLRRQLMVAASLAGAFGCGAFVLGVGGRGWLVLVVNMGIGASSVWIVGARATFANHTPPDQMAQVEATMVASITLVEGAGVLGIGLLVTLIGPWVGYALVAVPIACTTLPLLSRSRPPLIALEVMEAA